MRGGTMACSNPVVLRFPTSLYANFNSSCTFQFHPKQRTLFFSLGAIFSVVMIGFAAGYVLYDTSNVLHHYRIGQHVAAALALFATVALLFWYVLRLVIAITGRN